MFDLVISIVIFNPNHEYLRQTLESALNSQLHCKVVLIDNSAEPLPVEFLQEYLDQIEYQHNDKNLGFGKAHNLAIKQYAKATRYFLILNPDISFDSKTLDALAAKMDADERIGLSIPKIFFPDETPQFVNKRLPNPFVLFLRPFCKRFSLLNFLPIIKRYECQDIDQEKSFICPSISGCMMFFRASVLSKLGGFDERYFLYFEDIDLSRRTALNHLTVVFHDLHAYHHWHRGAYLERELFKHLLHSARLYFQKFGWFIDPRRRRLNRIAYYHKSG